MERFVRAIVSGGLLLVAGLWLAVLFPARPSRLLGAVLALLGAGGLAFGIWSEVEHA